MTPQPQDERVRVVTVGLKQSAAPVMEAVMAVARQSVKGRGCATCDGTGIVSYLAAPTGRCCSCEGSGRIAAVALRPLEDDEARTAAIEWLRTALKLWGQHNFGCAKHHDEDDLCHCGLDAALSTSTGGTADAR